jgi:hypothetical protein
MISETVPGYEAGRSAVSESKAAVYSVSINDQKVNNKRLPVQAAFVVISPCVV